MAKEVSAEQLFENIAVDNRLITKFQLEKAKKALEDRDDSDAVGLGDVLVEMGFIDEKQHDSIKSAQNYRTTRNTDKRFGRQIVRMKLAKPTIIQELLKKQKETYEKTGKTVTLGQLLIKEGEVSKKDIRAVREEIANRDSQKISERQKALQNDRHFVQCPNCSSKLLIKPHNFDKTVKCSTCEARFKATIDGAPKSDDFDMPIVADLDIDDDDDDDDVIDIEEIELEEAEQKALASAPSNPIDDDIFDNLPDDQGLTNLDDHTAPDEDDLAELDDLDPDALKSDQFDDLDDDLDIDDLDIDALDDDELASDILTSDSAPEDEFDEDLDDDFLKDLDDDDEIEDISDVDSDLSDLESDDVKSDSDNFDDIEPMEDFDDIESPETGLGGLEMNEGLLDSGMDASWATNAFDDRPIHARPEDDIVESLVPLDKPEDVTETVAFNEDGTAIIPEEAEDIPGASVLDDDLYENLEEENIGTDDPEEASEDSKFGSLNSPDRVIKSVPVATSSKELDAEIGEVPALGNLLDEIDDEDIDSELEGVRTDPGLNAELKVFTEQNVDVLAENEEIHEKYPDSLILNREANSDPANKRPEKSVFTGNPFPSNPFANPVEEPKPLFQNTARETRVFSSQSPASSILTEEATDLDTEKLRTERVANFAEELSLQGLDWLQARTESPGSTQLSEDEVREAFEKAMKVILEELKKNAK
ncbi:MAG: hypothetical protein P1V97_22240 [Planctomycetota bacterium]|nr:hypothetical protein [Planctomycetota bacterium]